MSFTDSTAVAVAPRGLVDWPAIFAGTVVTTAIALVLLTFGGALGLSMSSPYEGEGMAPAAFAIAAGLWLLWVQIVSFGAGGYVAGRLRPRVTGVSEYEVDVRDGLHGLVVWASGVIIAAVIAAATIGGATTAARTAETASDPAAAVAAVVTEEANEAAAEETVTNPEAADETATERRAEVARKLTVVSAFITAASLLIGAVIAMFAAGLGGRHRDEQTVFALLQLRPGHSAPKPPVTP
jgi:hypothetical protein